MKVCLCALVCCFTVAAVAGRAQSDSKAAAENEKNKIDRKRLCGYWQQKTLALPALLSGLPAKVKKGCRWEFFDCFIKSEYAKNEKEQIPRLPRREAEPEDYTEMKLYFYGKSPWLMGAYKVENGNLRIMFFLRSPERGGFFRSSTKVEGKTIIYEAKIIKLTDRDFQTKDANGDCLEFIKEHE